MGITVNKLLILILVFSSSLAMAKEFVYQAEMECNHCAKQIKSACKKVRKLKSYKADPEKDIIKISFEDKDEPFTEKELNEISQESGYFLTLKK